ncbi:mazg protein [Parvularcula bermudensis HTCC2503]|uniref:Mazg protein n=1 Tax=Parvularcula bermudensis (strain ATCC BAA-594 / HTCC2503 / KCTC 12087) TaxID=314260 RepID=E0TDR8_PARBH|nr:nucleoside triphosphate pyrophosphohydrolase [Parvularcula bermudensis]ADM09984.1 mazg protein [Parvularcula bermudensis HTCC2503]
MTTAPLNAPPRTLDALVEIMARLRDPETGCPWDVTQTHRSIARYALEEAYEVVDAIERDDDRDLCEELGDLLLQVVFHAQMAKERGAFTLEDVLDSISTKMIRRHPHVFGAAAQRSAEGQATAWEDHKAAERAAKGKDASVLDDVPLTLPALTRAEKYCKRAARLGFNWPTPDAVLEKLHEEIAEVEEALATGDEAAIADEIGDVLFTVTTLTQHLGLHAEDILRGGNQKFARRFGHIERQVQRSGRGWDDHRLEELEAYWQDAKRVERETMNGG